VADHGILRIKEVEPERRTNVRRNVKNYISRQHKKGTFVPLPPLFKGGRALDPLAPLLRRACVSFGLHFSSLYSTTD